ncbi:hypothetical protein AB0G02_31910 [Actinosynnema sp. NPDC023658]|uniref:hypothetical protein n=1 Tax=Actinosynnema sp. NPDC023658 TaxID=3155465 RepID=UPI0033D489B5
MRFEVENSGLTPAEVAGALPGPVERADRDTGYRGPLVDVLVSVAENVAAGAVTAKFDRLVDGLAQAAGTRPQGLLGDDGPRGGAGRRRRQRDRGGPARRRHGRCRKLELEIGDQVDGGRVTRIRFSLPEE